MIKVPVMIGMPLMFYCSNMAIAKKKSEAGNGSITHDLLPHLVL
jgi:hypothetical protein